MYPITRGRKREGQRGKSGEEKLGEKSRKRKTKVSKKPTFFGEY